MIDAFRGLAAWTRPFVAPPGKVGGPADARIGLPSRLWSSSSISLHNSVRACLGKEAALHVACGSPRQLVPMSPATGIPHDASMLRRIPTLRTCVKECAPRADIAFVRFGNCAGRLLVNAKTLCGSLGMYRLDEKARSKCALLRPKSVGTLRAVQVSNGVMETAPRMRAVGGASVWRRQVCGATTITRERVGRMD
jgi:hypothetical protein